MSVLFETSKVGFLIQTKFENSGIITVSHFLILHEKESVAISIS
jgi:hypothetical protein